MATNLYAGVDAQADLARKRASQVEQRQVSTQKDAMMRRAAQMGGGPGGAMVKQDRIIADESAQRLQQANEGIEAARMGEHGRIAGVLQGQEYATSEREAGQRFATGEREATQRFATGERLGTQQFVTSERLGTQKYATGEREASQAFAAAEAKKQLQAQFTMQKNQILAAAKEGRKTREQAQKQLDELSRQFNEEMRVAEQTNKVNTILSANNSGLKPEVLGQLLSALGINIGSIPGLTASRGSGGGGGGGPANLVSADTGARLTQFGPAGQPAAPGYGWNPATQRWEKVE